MHTQCTRRFTREHGTYCKEEGSLGNQIHFILLLTTALVIHQHKCLIYNKRATLVHKDSITTTSIIIFFLNSIE